MTDFSRFDAIIDERLEDWIAELLDFLPHPVRGRRRGRLRAAADWTAHRLRRAGCAVEVLELGEDVPPLVVGELGDGPRTLDQRPPLRRPARLAARPVDARRRTSPAIRDGRIWARGATDNKGELLPRIWALEAWTEAIGPLPCRVRHLVEGQEETGSRRPRRAARPAAAPA